MFGPGPAGWTGAGTGLLVGVATLWVLILHGVGPGSAFGWGVSLAFVVVVTAASLALGHLAIVGLERLGRAPMPFRWLIVGASFLLFMMLLPAVLLTANAVILAAAVALAGSLVGAAIGAWFARRGTEARRPTARRLVAASGGALVLALVAWGAWPGPPPQSVPAPVASSVLPPLELANPALPGPYRVAHLTYGSGTDRRRAMYGAGVDLRTATVDISALVDGWNGFPGWLRTAYWGFDATRVPLNARVWYPSGDGPFPLVLVAHGNHSMDVASEGGYEFLGEFLASRGFIVASVDQNYLNESPMVESMLGGLRNENDARAYLLLEHLRWWHDWNEDPDSPFFRRVDPGNVALVGHSRGGEAAAIAAAFDRLPRHPDDGDVRFDFGFGIRAVVALAPSDGQYRPRGEGTTLEDVNYLVLQGAADADVRSFQGAIQYDRVRFTGTVDAFKAAVYVHGANHGQFNRAWGRFDRGAARWFLDHRAIMPPEDQERVARTFIGAFLEATLRDAHEYRALFASPQAGREFLPGTPYLSQYAASDALAVATFAEDAHLESTTLPGGRLGGTNLEAWGEGAVTLGSGRRRDMVGAYLRWSASGADVASYDLRLPEDVTIPAGASLAFDIANRSSDREPLDLTVELTDRSGTVARLTLADVAPLPPPFTYRMFKPPLRVPFDSEPVFATYTLPLAAFRAEDRFDPGSLRDVRFVFDRSPNGFVILGNIVFVGGNVR